MASTPPPPFPASAPVPHGRPDDTASRSREGGLGVAVLGSTGSIGTSTLEVIAASAGLFRPHLFAAHTSVGPLLEQARIHRPAWVVVTDPAAAATIGATALPAGTQLAVGPEALDDLVGAPEVDRVVSAIVGAAGLRSTVAALEAGKTVALANKETLVMAGPLVMRLAAERGARLDADVMRQGRLAEKSHDVQAMIQADLAFHRAIYQASGNPLIAQSIDLHWHHLKRVMGAVLQSSQQRQNVWDDHEAIAHAISTNDTDLAVRLVQEHANKASVQLTARLSEQIQHLKTGAPP